MKKIYYIIFLLNIIYLNSVELNKNYLQIKGEAPLGQFIIPVFDITVDNSAYKFYTLEDAISIAKNEILEFVSGMVYGYNFIYKLDNPVNKTKGYFDLIPIKKIDINDKNLILYDKYLTIPRRMRIESFVSEIIKYIPNDDDKKFVYSLYYIDIDNGIYILKDNLLKEYEDKLIHILEKIDYLNYIEDSKIIIRALYRLNKDQKEYIKSFNSSIGKLSYGSEKGTIYSLWNNRLEIYKNAIKNSIYNCARKNIKSRPLYIKGKLLLNDSPLFTIDRGNWVVTVNINLIIDKVDYIDSY